MRKPLEGVHSMIRKRFILAAAVTISFMFLAGVRMLPLQAQRAPEAKDNSVAVGATDIGGVVTSGKGAEAGVWVIAETTSLPTKFVKIVVTDDRGRYLVPDLPRATYSLWVRGY